MIIKIMNLEVNHYQNCHFLLTRPIDARISGLLQVHSTQLVKQRASSLLSREQAN